MSLLEYSSQLLKHAEVSTKHVESCGGLSVAPEGNTEIQKMIQEFERELGRTIKAGDVINGTLFSLICINCTSQIPDVLKIKKTNLMSSEGDKNIH